MQGPDRNKVTPSSLASESRRFKSLRPRIARALSCGGKVDRPGNCKMTKFRCATHRPHEKQLLNLIRIHRPKAVGAANHGRSVSSD